MNENLKRKHQIVDDVHNGFKLAKLAVLVEYRGVDVAGMSTLRRNARAANVQIQVVKNTLAKRAVENTDFECLHEYFTGPVAIALSVDPVNAAKTVSEFAKTNPLLKVQTGAMNGTLIDIEQVNQLAELPSREVLLGSLLGTLAAPLQKLVGTLHALPANLVYALAAIRDSKTN